MWKNQKIPKDERENMVCPYCGDILVSSYEQPSDGKGSYLVCHNAECKKKFHNWTDDILKERGVEKDAERKEQLFDALIKEAHKLNPKVKVYIEVIGDGGYFNSFSVISDPLNILERLEGMTESEELRITKIEIKDECVL